MDQLTKYLVYNRTPNSRNAMDYESIKKQKKEGKEDGEGIPDKRLLLLSPEPGRRHDETVVRMFHAWDPVLKRAKAQATSTTAISLGMGASECYQLLIFEQSNMAHSTSVDITIENLAANEERVLYPRHKLIGARPSVVGGTPITEEQAMQLRITTFGAAACPPRGEWLRTPLLMRPPGQPMAYGLSAPRNGARSLLSALQAHVIRWLLFDSRPIPKDSKSTEPPEAYLRPNEDRQEEALWRACAEVIWRSGGGPGTNQPANADAKAIVALPSEKTYVQHSSFYYQDTVTEKLHLFEFKTLEDVQIFIKRYLFLFQAEDGAGALLLLYSVVLSRGCENIIKDLDGKLTYLVSSHVEGSLNIVTLLLTGRATPYLHNGVIYVGDEDHYAMPQYGVLSRSPVGLLVYYGGEDSAKSNANRQYPGSRLKTPAMPVWVTSCSGHFGILFNTNRELLRNYHAERRFDIQYYTCGGCHVMLNVDTRAHDEGMGMCRADDISATPLEKLIHTKWQEAKITWTGPTPYVGETPK